MRLPAFVALLAVASFGDAPAARAAEANIIGGTTDTGDPAVVLLYMTVPGKQGGALCTGEVISPHVVLTAAHCTGGEDPTVTNATWQVYLGDDFSKATAADLLPVKEAHYNQQFSVNALDKGYDVGVAILQNALPATIKPRPFNHTTMDTTMAGKPVRFVGYGLDNEAAQTGAGVKRQTSTTLTDLTTMLLHFSDGAHETCNGDSGGPAFMTLGGQEVIVGLTSYGDVQCAAGGYDTRTDAVADWVDGWVAMADPGFSTKPTSGGSTPSGNSTPPSPSGGTQAPPTSSATPMPPSSTGAGGVGASCVSDNDCQSHLCGLDNKGGHMCFAANANDVNGGMGCAAAAGGRAADDGSTAALALALFVGLWAKLARTARARRS